MKSIISLIGFDSYLPNITHPETSGEPCLYKIIQTRAYQLNFIYLIFPIQLNQGHKESNAIKEDGIRQLRKYIYTYVCMFV